MSLGSNPENSSQWKVIFTPGYFAAVKAMSQEMLAREMNGGHQPSQSNVVMSTMDSDHPYIKVRTPEDVFTLAERLDRFAEDTDGSVMDLILDWPPESALLLVDERRAHGELAKELSSNLLKEGEYIQILSQESVAPDDWLRDIEG